MTRYIFLTMLAALLCGCAGSLETARTTRLGTADVARTRDDARCQQLDRQHRRWGAVAAGAAVLSGASGISTIPAPSSEAQIGLAAGSLAAAAVAAGALSISESAATSWARECGE